MKCAHNDYPLILASSSPRRRQLLTETGVRFEVVDPPLGEPAELPEGLTPAEQAQALAYFKARSVADQRPEAAVLAADTLVAVGGHVLGKPADRDDARRMLQTLAGTRHEVISGVALLWPPHRRHILSVCTFVTMRPLSDQELNAYLDSGEWQDKAGAYAIQETADRYVVKVEGSFSNVVGLPVERVLELLEHVGIGPADERGAQE